MFYKIVAHMNFLIIVNNLVSLSIICDDLLLYEDLLRPLYDMIVVTTVFLASPSGAQLRVIFMYPI